MRPRNAIVLYGLSIPSFYLGLFLRARYHGEPLWRPPALRNYKASDAIQADGEAYYHERLRSGEDVEREAGGEFLPAHSDMRRPLLCVAIDSHERRGADYFPSTPGSMLMEMSQKEREMVYLVVGFKEGKENIHYEGVRGSDMVDLLVDREGMGVTKVGNLNWSERFGVASSLSDTAQRLDAEGTLDVVHLLQACLTKTEAPYVLIVEDDVVPARGWFRTFRNEIVTALRAERLPWGYVFLFWDHTFMGWAEEDAWSLVVWGLGLYLAMVGLCAMSGLLHTSRRCSRDETERGEGPRVDRPGLRGPGAGILLAALPLLLLPHGALLLFQGRHALLPCESGLTRNTGFAYCSQSQLFSRSSAEYAITHLVDGGYTDGRRPTARDVALSDLERADPVLFKQLLWKPSLFQHTGVMSGKGFRDEHRIRNWAFEEWSF